MNSIKNLKSVRHNFAEFDASENVYLNDQYKSFRKRLVEAYLSMNRTLSMKNKEEQYRGLLTVFLHLEEEDNQFIKNTLNAVSEKKVQEVEISSLLLVNRLFTQACRMQIYGMKDLVLSREQIPTFDRAMDMKQIADPDETDSQENSEL
jgi:phosphate:Na+ symporter